MAKKRPKPKKHRISVRLVKTGFTVKRPDEDYDLHVGVSFDREVICSRCGCLDKLDRPDRAAINRTVQLHGRLIKLLYKQRLAKWNAKVERSLKKNKRKKKKNRQERSSHTRSKLAKV